MPAYFSFSPAGLFRCITAAIFTVAVLPAVSGAADNNAGTIHDLGVQYINGDDVPADAEKGRYHIHRAALLHFPLAQYHLGILFYTGEGGDKNTACARWWLGKSALAGGDINRMAQQVLADIDQVTADNPAERILLTQPADIARCEKLPERATFSAAVQAVQKITSAAEALPVIPPFLAQTKRFTRLSGHLTESLKTQVSQLWSLLSSPVIPPEPPVTIHPSETIIPDSLISPSVPDNHAPLRRENKNIRPALRNTGRDLRTAPAHHYTLQLSSAATPDGLYQSARRHKLSNYLVYETVRNGRQWYVLVYGDYPDLPSAQSALHSLPSAFYNNKPWVRSLKQVQRELP
ncbi:SPOR domain-containing protein [Morganella morganii]|uniref:SPOR domain-containing protein n=1 Tax=Morganella morganii TaxID=582 RepID=UPI0023681C6F|nr:SPOR domain-containing protein [Morganella morganii]